MNGQIKWESVEINIHTHTHTHTQRGDGVIFRWNHSAFLLRSAWIEILLGLYNFPDAHTILLVTTRAYALHVDSPPV